MDILGTETTVATRELTLAADIAPGATESTHIIEDMVYEDFPVRTRVNVTHTTGVTGRGVVFLNNPITKDIGIKVYWNSVVYPV
jgi:hypothetical protein